MKNKAGEKTKNNKTKIIMFIFAVVIFVLSFAVFIYGLNDLSASFKALENPENKTALSYFGMGWGLGIGLSFICPFGLMFSIISSKMNDNLKLKGISYVLIILNALLLVFANVVFFI